MKKSLFIAVALISIGFTSCKKDWTCACRDNTLGEMDEYTIKDSRRPEASLSCDALEIGYDDCTLK